MIRTIHYCNFCDFATEINRRDCCGEGFLDKKFAKKVRSGKYWGR